MKTGEAAQSASGGGTPLLHGSDLAKNQSSITLNVTGCREAPDGFKSAAIMDFEPIELNGVEYGAMPVNKTNMKALIAFVGEDMDLEDVRGRATFTKILVNNPSTNQPTYGLSLTDFREAGQRAARPPAAKAKPAAKKGGKKKS